MVHMVLNGMVSMLKITYNLCQSENVYRGTERPALTLTTELKLLLLLYYITRRL